MWSPLNTVMNAPNSARQLASDLSGRKPARENRDYVAQREDSAMQRRVADLKKAGLNPLLAVGTNGASSDASAAGPTSNVGPVLSAGTSALSMAGGIPSGVIGLLQGVANIRQTEANTAKTAAEIPQIQTGVDLNRINIGNADWQRNLWTSQMLGNMYGIGQTVANTAKAKAETANTTADTPAKKEEAKTRVARAKEQRRPENLTVETSPISPVLKDAKYILQNAASGAASAASYAKKLSQIKIHIGRDGIRKAK